jgi:hypothetical protein
MDKIIQMDKHHIEAWGLWWFEWQKQTKQGLQQQASSIRSKGKNLPGNSATRLVLPPK